VRGINRLDWLDLRADVNLADKYIPFTLLLKSSLKHKLLENGVRLKNVS
jgi:hypothetical protein